MMHIVRTVSFTAIVKIVVEQLPAVVLRFRFFILINNSIAKGILR